MSTDAPTDLPADAAAEPADAAAEPAEAPAPPQPAAPAAPAAPTSDPDTHRFECRSCGFVYDPAEGVRKLGIESGTPFSALDPVGFRCPVCRSRVGAFKDRIKESNNEPSCSDEHLVQK